VGKVYYKTDFIVKQGFSRPIDLEIQTDQETHDLPGSFETTEGPFQGAKLPAGADDKRGISGSLSACTDAPQP